MNTTLRRHSRLVALLCLLPLASCQSVGRRVRALDSYAVGAARSRLNSYNDPGAISIQGNRTMNGLAAAGGAVGGVVGGLATAAILTTASAVKQARFKKNNLEVIARLRSHAPATLHNRAKAKLSAALGAHPHFGTRTRSTSPNHFEIEVIGHGLVRPARQELYVPAVVAELTLLDADGKTVFKREFIGVGTSDNEAPGQILQVYAGNPATLRSRFDRALDDFVRQVIAFLDQALLSSR